MKKQLLLSMAVLFGSLTMTAQNIVTTTMDNQAFAMGTNTTLPVHTWAATSGRASVIGAGHQLRGTSNTNMDLAATLEFDLQTASGTVDGKLSFDFGKVVDTEVQIEVTVGTQATQTFTFTGNKGETNLTTYELFPVEYNGDITFSTTPIHVKFDIIDLDKSPDVNNTTLPGVRIYSVNVDKSNGTLATEGVIANENKFTLFPNPTKDSFQLNAKANQNVKNVAVYNMVGQLVKSFAPSYKYDTSSLASGAYVIKISTDNGYDTIKLLKN
ncbi:T9SS type A sorting domain-containing protein [Tamlana agarivorans]|uniref:T9SS type A sorting domain-containing protein n=1 Tax=Pseudotamlana agarivorans TaxID=481183 RepID=A0ACC5U9D8_9FLAO|nr:T9SS type A sorting domain-containing protein [Tamlana agarivorans]MBU2950947.1 T9SS type A sorting domain-containing protein [Tamlana agarivorans]